MSDNQPNEPGGQCDEPIPTDVVGNVPKTSRPGPFRKVALPSILAALIVAWALLYMQQTALEAKAGPLAGKALRENSAPNVEAVSKITVSREAVLFGTPHAKVEVFIRPAGGDSNARIQGIEYDYALEDGEWILRDSGGCSGDECAIRGRDAFERRAPAF